MFNICNEKKIKFIFQYKFQTQPPIEVDACFLAVMHQSLQNKLKQIPNISQFSTST